ncbi:hypothetical protein [Polymorphobacter sp.]|uniref:hypothetical protein n=1 Tax=Polymorphobacter sp. TaxID=1909290 RepID=UPI003F723A91
MPLRTPVALLPLALLLASCDKPADAPASTEEAALVAKANADVEAAMAEAGAATPAAPAQ